MEEKVEKFLSELVELIPITGDFSFINRRGVLLVSHCNSSVRMSFDKDSIFLTCIECSNKAEIQNILWLTIQSYYQQFLIVEAFNNLNLRLEKLEKTVYDDREKRAIELVMERDQDREILANK